MPPVGPLPEQQSWFQLVFDSTSDLMSLHRVEADGRFVFENLNRSLREFHRLARPGIDPDRWLGRDLAEVMRTDLGFTQAQVENVLSPYREAVASGLGLPISHISAGVAGARYREGTITPLKDAAGRVTHLFYRGADVTARREAEAELRRSAERFSSLLATSPVPISVVRRSDGVFLALSDSWARTMGYEAAEVLGHAAGSLGLWVDPAERDRVFGGLEAGHPVLARHTRFRVKSGEVRTFLFSAALVTWNGEDAILAFPVDIEDLVRARASAEASEARLQEEQRLSRSMMDNTSDLMAIYRIDGTRLLISEWNPALRRFYAGRLTEAGLDAWMGRSIEDFLAQVNHMDPGAIEERLRPFRKAITSRQPVSYATSIPGADAPQHRESLIVPLTDATGRVTHLFYRAADVTASRRADEELRRSAERFARVFEDSPVASTIASLEDGRYMEVNDAWCALTGIARAEAIGTTAQEAGFWADDAARRASFAPILERGESVQLELPYANRQGRALHLLMSAGPIELDGRLCLLTIIQDVTRLEEARTLAARLTGQLAGLFNLVPNALAVVQRGTGRLLATNNAWSRQYGWSRDEAMGRTALDIGLWAEPSERAGFVEQVVRDARLRPTILRLKARDGQDVLSLTSAESIDWQGEPAMLVSHEDVTELERARREAQASSERFAKVFDLSPTPIVVGAIADGRYLAVNDAWLQLHGYSRAELEGHGSLSLGVWADPADRARIANLVSRGIEVRRVPMRFRKKSGEVFETLYSATLADWEGQQAIIATPQDVTELNRAAGEIRRLNETLEERVARRTAELEAANRELESFSYSVSHDLRAPLRAMSAFSALLSAHPAVAANPEAAGHAKRINAAATRMGTIVDALLQFSRLSRQAVAMRPVDLAAEVDSVIAEQAQATAGRRIRWVVPALPVVRGDPTLLRLVLQNLIENAVKYTAPRDEAVIEVDATRAGGETVVRVRDNGVGFDMQYADKVFGVFERLHADGEFEGTGIGLANARRIVQRHGGRIWCEAAPGAGAAFYFSLPD